jgi:cytoskeletal protein RodZ
MDPIEKQEREREAFRRLRAQRHRAGELRGRVVAISLIGFVLLWGVVFAQMATGNDPVLSAESGAIATKTGARRAANSNAPPTEEASTDAREGAQRAATEGLESTDSEEVESQLVESEAARAAEAAEIEAAEAELAEVEVEPEPLTTSQS